MPAPGRPPGSFTLPPVPPPPADAPLSQGPQVHIREIRVEGATAFTPQEIAAVTAPYRDRLVTTADLNALRDKLTHLYIAAGYVNSGALLPDQRIVDGVVTYRIVEGVLSGIAVEPGTRLAAWAIRQRLAPFVSTPLDVNRLRRGIALLIDDPAIKSVRAELGAGTAPGTAMLRIAVTDAPLVDYDLTFDNQKSPAVGAFQLTNRVRLVNATGFGEAIDVAYAETKGFDSVEMSASGAVSPWDTRLRLAYQAANAEIVVEPGLTAEIKSKTRSYEVDLRQALHRTESAQLHVGAAMAHKRNQTFVLDRPFGLTAGVDAETGISRSTKASLYVEGLSRSTAHAVVLRATASWGLDMLGATVNDGRPTTDAMIAVAQLRAAYRPWTDFDATLLARFDAQVSDKRLLPIEQLAAGGSSTVRGYRENTALRDSGFTASLEARIPLLAFDVPIGNSGDIRGRLWLAPFVDFAHLWNASRRSADLSETEQLGSVGIGLRAELGSLFTASVYVAKRFHSPAIGGSSDLQDAGVHFMMRFQPLPLLEPFIRDF